MMTMWFVYGNETMELRKGTIIPRIGEKIIVCRKTYKVVDIIYAYNANPDAETQIQNVTVKLVEE